MSSNCMITFKIERRRRCDPAYWLSLLSIYRNWWRIRQSLADLSPFRRRSWLNCLWSSMHDLFHCLFHIFLTRHSRTFCGLKWNRLWLFKLIQINLVLIILILYTIHSNKVYNTSTFVICTEYGTTRRLRSAENAWHRFVWSCNVSTTQGKKILLRYENIR